MTSKAQRRAAKKRRRAPKGVSVASVDPTQLPGPLRQIVHQAKLFERYLTGAPDLPTATSMALADLRESAARLAKLAEPFDAFDVLELVRFSQSPVDAETYQESEHEGTAAVIELTALVLASRQHRAGSHPGEGGYRPQVDPAVEEILDAARAALEAGSMVVVLRAMAHSPSEATLGLGAILREVYVRNPAYQHMVRDTLVALFDDQAVAAACQAATGVTVAEILAVFKGIVAVQGERFAERMGKLGELVEMARVEMAKGKVLDAAAAASAPGSDSPPGYEIDPDVRAAGRALLDGAFDNPADVSVLSYDDVAGQAAVPRDVVDRVVDLFATDMDYRDPAEAAEEYFAGRSPFRMRPILRADGSAVVVHNGLLTTAVRPRMEECLKHAHQWDAYTKRRADYLERGALDLFSSKLPRSVVHRGFEYFVPDADAPIPQTVPSTYTKLVEGDGLLLVDDIAIVLEAKAGGLSTLARTGDRRRLASDLRKIVTNATAQATRVRERIVLDHGLRLRDGSWLDLDHVREVHAVAVSLDDLSGIATVTSHLVAAGLLPTDHLPWTVSLHDLQIVCELVGRPAELILYLRRRTEPDVTRKFHAVDELDFFLEFYTSGLYVEPDPDRVHAELPQLGDPSVAAKRRFRAQKLTFLTSRTDSLDAYYFHVLGIRGTPAPKPKMNADPNLLQLVDALARRGSPGWLSLGVVLLDASGPLQRKWARLDSDLAKMAAEDKAPHTLCIIGGSRSHRSFVLVWAMKGVYESVSQAQSHLELYTTAKKHQLQCVRGFGMLFDGTSPLEPTFTTFDNRRPGPDESLDRLVSTLMLQPIERAIRGFNLRYARARRR